MLPESGLLVILILYSSCYGKLIENESFRVNRISLPNHSTTATLFVQSPREGRQLSTKRTETAVETTPINNINESRTNSTKVKSVGTHKIERKIDTINERLFFYAKPSASSNQTQYNRSSKLYINYQQAYGIRYDPNKIRRSFSSQVAAAVNDAAASSTEATDVTVNEPDNITVDGTDVAQEITQETLQDVIDDVQIEETTEMDVDNFVIPESQPATEETIISTTEMVNVTTTTTNIMKPSRVQAALQFINQRVRNLFKYGLKPQDLQYLNLNVPQANENGQRFLNLFNVIKFDNIPCASHKEPLTPMNGTCYHQVECDQLGGVAVDDCAGGFGVCCVCK